MDAGIVRSQLEGALDGVGRLPRPAGLVEDDPEVEMGLGVGGIDLNRPQEVALGRLQVPLAGAQDAEVVVGGGVVRDELESPLVGLGRALGPPRRAWSRLRL